MSLSVFTHPSFDHRRPNSPILRADPLLSRTTFHMFSCQSLAVGEGWHPDDYSIDCDSDSHTGFLVMAALGVAIYPIGIPVSFFFLLRRDQTARAQQATVMIGDTSSEQASAFDFLRKDYKVQLVC